MKDLIKEIEKIIKLVKENNIKNNVDIITTLLALKIKIEQFGNLEEQLYNVPLEFILKHEYNKQVYWNNAYHEVRNIVPYEEHTEPYVEIFVRKNNKVVVKTLWFKDYGKTWWISDNRKE